MITAIALMCSYEMANQCQAIVNGAFFATEQECMGDLPKAVAYADDQDRYIRDYKCVVWGEPA